MREHHDIRCKCLIAVIYDKIRAYMSYHVSFVLQPVILDLQAAVRGMDTIQDLALKMANVRVNRFMVSGASKVHIYGCLVH